MSRQTPAARALVGCLALSADGATLNEALKLAGYSVKTATPISLLRGVCYRPIEGSPRRVVVRNGRVVRVSANAYALTAWMLKLGRKLSALDVVRSRAA